MIRILGSKDFRSSRVRSTSMCHPSEVRGKFTMFFVYFPTDPALWWLMCPPAGVELTMTMSPGRM